MAFFHLHSSLELAELRGAETGKPRLLSLDSEACISLLGFLFCIVLFFTFFLEIEVSSAPREVPSRLFECSFLKPDFPLSN